MTIDEFIQKEINDMNWWDKTFNNYPFIKTTKFLSFAYKKGEFGDYQMIKPLIYTKIIGGVFWIISMFFLMSLINLIIYTDFPLVISIPMLILLLLFIGFIIYHSFYNKEHHFKFRLDFYGICINNVYHSWNEINETLILERHEGRSISYYLVLLKKDETVVRINYSEFKVKPRFRIRVCYENKKGNNIKYPRKIL